MDKAQRSFMLVLALGAAAMAFGIYQVSQPWRGIIIAVTLFTLTIGRLLSKIVRDVLEYHIAKLHSPKAARVTPPPPIHERRRKIEVRQVNEENSGPVVL